MIFLMQISNNVVHLDQEAEHVHKKKLKSAQHTFLFINCIELNPTLLCRQV